MLMNLSKVVMMAVMRAKYSQLDNFLFIYSVRWEFLLFSL